MLDAADLRMARMAALWFIHAHQQNNRPAPPALHRLVDHLTRELSASGTEPEAPQPQFITTAEAAKRMGCTPRNVRRIAHRIRGVRVGNHWLIPLDSLEEPEP